MSVQEPRSPRLAEGTESSGLEVVAAFFTMSTPSRNTSSKHLSVVCGHVSAQFDVDLFKSQTALGKRNIKCVLVGSDWVTPTRLESLGGKGSAKNWKRSITYNKSPIGSILFPDGDICSDASLNGPASCRLGTPPPSAITASDLLVQWHVVLITYCVTQY